MSAIAIRPFNPPKREDFINDEVYAGIWNWALRRHWKDCDGTIDTCAWCWVAYRTNNGNGPYNPAVAA